MDKIEEAFNAIDRKLFVPKYLREHADIDAPLPIGYGQTISQPFTVKSMLEWLDAKEGDKVLDVGSGSGWTTALLSHIIGPRGKVYAVEIIPQLVKRGRDNCKKAGIKNAKFHQAGKEYGLPEHAPYDRILVSASADELPTILIDQLRVGGKLVIPVQNDILEVIKNSDNTYDTVPHPGFIFVPLVHP
jgi:protein-L-isoaspartate(D-aspartate) O-methyltransferase